MLHTTKYNKKKKTKNSKSITHGEGGGNEQILKIIFVVIFKHDNYDNYRVNSVATPEFLHKVDRAETNIF